MTNPTGTQYEISAGRYTAVITEVGAMCRSLVADGRELLFTFGPDESPSNSQSKELLPWPNRVADGRYMFDGVEYQLAVNEIERNTALHGLNDGRAWELVSQSDTEVVQRHTFYPEPGWPGLLVAEITHRLSEDGMTVVVRVTNDGNSDLPYGYGTHPYFEFGDLTDVELSLPFDKELIVDDERLLPIRVDDVTAEHDFREARGLGDAVFDTAFTAPRSPQWAVTMRGASHGVEVWADETLPWVQVFTTRPDRHAIAVEPMTCGPDAYNEGPTHDGVIRLAAGEEHVATWGVRAVDGR